MTTSKVKPITPGEVVSKGKKAIPDFVIEAFNKLIARGFNGRSSTVLQKDVVKEILVTWPADIPTTGENGKNRIYEDNWLEVESIYRRAGWDVDYDKPGYNEDYPASFTFTKKRMRRES